MTINVPVTYTVYRYVTETRTQEVEIDLDNLTLTEIRELVELDGALEDLVADQLVTAEDEELDNFSCGNVREAFVAAGLEGLIPPPKVLTPATDGVSLMTTRATRPVFTEVPDTV